MSNRTKYIKSEDDRIIIFPENIHHSVFKHFKPKSAGFITFDVNKDKPSCTCYGQSFSLGLYSEKEDTRLAMMQILGYEFFELYDLEQ
jgi:hypothetical protein